ncbi:MAG TPA: glycosyltransferase family 39 protein [Candidatus Dormibacteraeota bacterium]|nr:glycosyltransferase family 39 protein [Candidatus Dormibacteraeota bacterium]
MTSRLGSWLRDPLFLLCLTAGLLAFVVQSGELGTADTMHRLQTTHWLWTSQPQVFPNEYPEFGLHGRGGRIFSWYGIGQSLLMLPADLVGTWIAHWRVFSHYEDDPAVRSIVVSYSTSILVNVLTVLIAFRFLRQLRFGDKEAVAGVLALLFCTTHLHYTQNMQENNYILLLTLVGFSYQYEWLRSGSGRALFVGSVALGLNLLTRVTTGLDLMAAGVFLLLLLLSDRVSGRQIWDRLVAYCKVAAPVYLLFALIERLYSFYRFGSLTQTYIPIFARESRLQDPTLPANFPWSTPFHEGVLGALFKPEKSIFLFDPLLILTLVLVMLLWARLDGEVRAYAVTSVLLLVGYISFYARYTYWAGDFAWGDRYVSSAVEMVALIAVPLLVRYRANLGVWVWRVGMGLIVVSLVVQIASLMFWLPLEIYQMETLGHPTFVIALRFKNIAAFALGKMDAWGLNTDDMGYDAWDYVHITTWNFLPFLLRRVGAAPKWVVDAAFGLWGAGLTALAAALSKLRMVEG